MESLDTRLPPDEGYLEAITIALRISADEHEFARLRRAIHTAYRLRTGRRVPDALLLRESALRPAEPPPCTREDTP